MVSGSASRRKRAAASARTTPATRTTPGVPTVHQVKVTLRGASPPIWRRLDVPSGATLQDLHEYIQRAFDWEGYHMWVFETPLGEYGAPDPQLGHRDATSTTVGKVAPRAGSRIRYTYDFGDDWEHDVVVEGVHDAEPGAAYPRCLTGQRACPPEDCGGIWGYEHLVEIMADPSHEEHESMLDWLGLESASEFHPDQFDLDDVGKDLSGVATVLRKG